MATLDWDGLVFYDQQIKKHIENKLVDAGISKNELDKILDKYASKTYVADEIAKAAAGDVDLTIYAKTADVDAKLANYVKKNDSFSGSYNDLTDKPTIPNLTGYAKLTDIPDITGKADKTYVDTELVKKANKSELFSGSYNDLNDKPTIPDTSNLATKVELNNHIGSTKHITDDERTKWNGYNDTINTMKTNFEDGVNTIYNAVVAKGITPLDKSPSSIVDAIESLIFMPSEPLLTYTFETGSPIIPLLNDDSSYIHFCEDTDNYNGTTTRKLYVAKEVNKISFKQEIGTPSIISLDNTASSIKLTSTNSMFYNCGKLRYVNLRNLDTSQVTNMRAMFEGCNNLQSLDLSNLNTSNVTDMRYTFKNCESLTSLDLSNFDTSKVDSMYNMFDSCKSLTSLDLSNFDTSKVTIMSEMFNGCNKLASLNIRNFDTSKVANISSMFRGCKSLTSLDLHSFNTSKVFYMNDIFNECNSLTSLDLSNFNTSQVFNMNYMFSGCRSLTSLDIRNFSSASLTDFSNMLGIPSNCKIYVDKTKFTKTEAECNFKGTFIDVSQQG